MNPTESRIRPAALRLFAQRGYAAVSMRQIAAEVGVQAGALYLYIPDKQTLLFDILHGHMQHILGDWRRVAPAGTPMERLEAFVRFHIGHTMDHPDEVFVGMMELRNLDEANHAAITRLWGDYESELEAILRDGSDSGCMRIPDSRLATVALLAMLNGVHGWHRDGGRLSRERVERISWNMVRRAVGG